MILYMLKRIGLFFMLVGLLLILITFTSGRLKSQTLTLLCASIPLVIIGGGLWFRNQDRTQSERFRILRRKTSKDGEEKD